MSAPIIGQADCCSSCTDSPVVNVPGPQGGAGTNGTNGTNGVNAFTTTTAQFTQPAVSSNVTVTVANSTWITATQVLYIQNGGYYQVVSIPDATHVTVTNLGYTGNASPAANVPSTSQVSPGGFQGPQGSVPGGSLAAANNLSDVASVSTSRSNLGLGSLAVLNSVNNSNWSGTALAVGNGGTGATIAATALSNLGGQPLNALLTSLALQGAAANQMYYTTALNTIGVVVSTAFGRGALTDANTVAARSRLGGLLPQYGLLGSVTGLDLNTAGDNAIQIESGRYRVDRITVESASTSITTATVGVFTSVGGAGTTVAADQGITALTAPSKFKDLTLGGTVSTDTIGNSTIYARVGTPQGTAATANLWIFGWKYV